MTAYAWMLRDKETGEPAMLFRTRAEARALAGDYAMVVHLCYDVCKES